MHNIINISKGEEPRTKSDESKDAISARKSHVQLVDSNLESSDTVQQTLSESFLENLATDTCYWDVPKAANYLGISEEALRKRIDRGRIWFYQPDPRGTIWFTKELIDSWMESGLVKRRRSKTSCRF